MLDTGSCLPSHALEQCFSSFLMRRPFNTFPHVVGTPTIQLLVALNSSVGVLLALSLGAAVVIFCTVALERSLVNTESVIGDGRWEGG